MSMQTYLAAKYMSGPKADAILKKSGKKKKKHANSDWIEPASTSSAFIIDEDEGWGNHGKPDDEPEQVEDVIVASDRSFKKRDGQGATGWTTVKEPTPPPTADEEPIIVE